MDKRLDSETGSLNSSMDIIIGGNRMYAKWIKNVINLA